MAIPTRGLELLNMQTGLEHSDSCLSFLYQFALPLNPRERAALSRLLPLDVCSQLFQRFRLELSAFDFEVSAAEKEMSCEMARCLPQSRAYSGVAHKELYAIMKPTRLCNLRCHYCNAWREGPGNTMSFQVLAKATIEILQGLDI